MRLLILNIYLQLVFKYFCSINSTLWEYFWHRQLFVPSMIRESGRVLVLTHLDPGVRKSGTASLGH